MKHNYLNNLPLDAAREIFLSAADEIGFTAAEETVPSALMNAFRWGALPGKTAEEKEASYRAGGERLRTFAAARAAARSLSFSPKSPSQR